MKSKKYILKTALYELTLRCNMNCLHCGSSAGAQRKEELHTEQWNDLTTQLADMGCERIGLLGGEPFLRNDWYEISKEIKDHDMKVIYVTNGFLLTKNTIEKLKEIDPYVVGVSLDGASAKTHDAIRGVTGSFERCREILQLLREAGIETSVITTISTMNYKELPEIRDYLKNKGITWQLQIAIPIGRFQKELMVSADEFYATGLFIASIRRKYSLRELPVIGAHSLGYFSDVLPNFAILPNWNGCQAGISSVGIQSDGGVKGCLSLPEDYVQGNIKEKSLQKIWNEPGFCSYTRNFNVEKLKGDCKTCRYGKKCKGGCLAASIGITGEVFSDPYCFSAIEKKTK
jgi:radical SAM protein with 4Fe4S-binding SPASM domain